MGKIRLAIAASVLITIFTSAAFSFRHGIGPGNFRTVDQAGSLPDPIGTAVNNADLGTTCRKTRILVVPFSGGSKNPSQAHFSLGLPAVLAERFEQDACLESVNGPIVLTREQAAMLGANGEHVDLIAANRLATAKGAAMFVSGSFGGKVENWKLTVDVYAAGGDEPKLIGGATAVGIIYDNGLSSRAVHEMLARATSDAFKSAGLTLPKEDIASVAKPSTEDGYAFLLLNRAYGRFFRETARGTTENGLAGSPRAKAEVNRPGSGSALSIAEYAVRIDPKFVEAQRFYAYLLSEKGRAKKARIHYEAVLTMRPNDVRSLLALGMIEIDQKNAVIAENYLKRAVTARSADPRTHFWLGRAKLRLGNIPGAVAEFETTRSLEPRFTEARRELVGLYSTDHRYDEAAEELRAMMLAEPDDLDAVFQLAACLRAGGRIQEAVDAYSQAMISFPKESRLEKFRQDLLSPKADGISVLIRSVPSGKVLMDSMEDARRQYQTAANDAVIDLVLEKKSGCDKSRGAAALAKKIGNKYAWLGEELGSQAESMRISFERGDSAALAPDELLMARQVVNYAGNSGLDLHEMTSLYRKSVMPFIALHGCNRSGEAVVTATIDEVRDRNEKHVVKLDPAKPSAAGGVISPEVPPDPARIIRFTVKNTTGVDYLVFLDDDAAPVAAIPPNKEAELKARAGRHRLCVISKGDVCESADYRQVTLHDLWAMTVKK